MADVGQQTGGRGRVARLERLIEISRSLNSTLSLRPLLRHIIVAAQELTETEAGSVLLVDRRSDQLHFEAATGAQGYRMPSIVVPMAVLSCAQRGRPGAGDWVGAHHHAENRRGPWGRDYRQ